MATVLSPSEALTYSTVRIECDIPGGVSTGTGFFYNFLENATTHVPAIVTNRHVVKDAVQGRFHLHRRDEHGDPIPGRHQGYRLDDFQARWIGHPDPAVDLAIMPINPLLEEIAARGDTAFYIPLGGTLIPSTAEFADLTALEDVVMVGYPNGIWDSFNNMPIVRKGITATSPSLDYEGRREFMIDAACFPGSSGSPVFLFNIGSYTTRSGGTMLGSSRIKLLGVLYAGPQFTAEGEVRIVNVPTQQRVVSVSAIPQNLGLVIKSQRLLEFEKSLRSMV